MTTRTGDGTHDTGAREPQQQALDFDVRPSCCPRCGPRGDPRLDPTFDAETFTWICSVCASTWCAEPRPRCIP